MVDPALQGVRVTGSYTTPEDSNPATELQVLASLRIWLVGTLPTSGTAVGGDLSESMRSWISWHPIVTVRIATLWTNTMKNGLV